MEEKHSLTVVQYFGEKDVSSCGYCKSTSSRSSYGMWAHKMTVEDYQGLIDRGWRRSGCYCYKPTLETSCCPLYTIRCSALNFSLSKSQKKVIKKFNRYILADERRGTSLKCPGNFTASKDTDTHTIEETSVKGVRTKANISSSTTIGSLSMKETQNRATTCIHVEKKPNSDDCTSAKIEHERQKKEDQNITTPWQNKAKILRKERKQIKLLKGGFSEEVPNAKQNSNIQQEKSLEEFLNDVLSLEHRCRLNVKLVRSSPPSKDCEQTTKESYELYRRYQITVHNSSIEECSFYEYKRFLVNSPLQAWKPGSGPSHGYGSFHQQYWLDGKLIAVGVVDILPKCISSVYFFYDPDLAFLTLGTYGCLREIAMVRTVHEIVPSIEFYYMGYYIHTCPKMQYKANYKPSYLLCPEVFTWHTFEECKQKLDQQKYSRLSPDITATDIEGNVNIDEVLVLYKHTATLYVHYKQLKKHTQTNEDNEVLQYAKIVGMRRSKSMLLYRADD